MQPQPTPRTEPVGTVKGVVVAEKYWHGGRIAVQGDVLEFPAEVWGYSYDDAAKKGEWKWLPFKFGESVKPYTEDEAKAPKGAKRGGPPA